MGVNELQFWGSLDHSALGDRPLQRVLRSRFLVMAMKIFQKDFSYSLNVKVTGGAPQARSPCEP